MPKRARKGSGLGAASEDAARALARAERAVKRCTGANDYCGKDDGEAFECPENRYMGRVIPGRGGGTISSCAAPSRTSRVAHDKAKAEGKKPPPRQLQFVVQPGDRRVKASTVRRRLRDQEKGVTSGSATDIAYFADYWQRAHPGERVPYPVGVEYPHVRGKSKCDRENPVWEGYPDGDTVAILGSPQAAAWEEVTQACVEGFEARQAARGPKASGSFARERAQRRQRALAEGVDLTSREYTDESKRQGKTVATRKRTRTKKAAKR